MKARAAARHIALRRGWAVSRLGLFLWERTLCATALRPRPHPWQLPPPRTTSHREHRDRRPSICRSAPCARHPFAPVYSSFAFDEGDRGMYCCFHQVARLPRASEPLPRPGSLSLACPRESNQRERHPAWRWPGYAQPVREGRPGFSTGLLPGRKVPDIRVGHPCGACSSTPHRPTGDVRRLVPLRGTSRCGEGGPFRDWVCSCGSAPCARQHFAPVPTPSSPQLPYPSPRSYPSASQKNPRPLSKPHPPKRRLGKATPTKETTPCAHSS